MDEQINTAIEQLLEVEAEKQLVGLKHAHYSESTFLVVCPSRAAGSSVALY